jgi:phospholipid/cholesterol/gamma-HCH transport system substrate-binding protein
MPRTRSIAWSELKVGVAGIVAMVLVATLVIGVGGQGGFFWQRYPLKARFDAVQGLKTGAVVRLSGKEVGRVADIQFAGRQIEVTLQVSRDVRPLITADSVATIGSLSLLGEPIVDLTASDKGPPLTDWAYLQTSAASGPFGTLTTAASETLTQANHLIGDLRAGRGTVGRLITDDALYSDLDRFVASATRVSKEIEAGKGTIGKLTGDPAAYASLKASLDNLKALTDRVNRGEGTLGKLLNDDSIAKSIASAATSVDTVASRLNKGEGTAGKLLTDQQLYNRLNELAAHAGQLVADLDAGRGTVGHLMHDQSLYDNVNKAVVEMRSFISDVHKDPKKYLHISFSLF